MNADPIARWYRWLEYAGFGPELAKRRNGFLAYVGGAKRILMLGEGDGRSLQQLIRQNRDATIQYVDLSKKMLELARQRAGVDRVSYVHGNALEVPFPQAEFDLIVTHFFLDCLDETQAAVLIARVTQAAQPGAMWLISEFRDQRFWSRWIVAGLYWFFRVATGLETRTLAEYRKLLRENGWRIERERITFFRTLVSEIWRYRP